MSISGSLDTIFLSTLADVQVAPGGGILFADTDGYFNGEISGDVLSFCYTQAGAMYDGKASSVISCTEVRHQH